MPKLQFTKGRFFITIPKLMVEKKKWKATNSTVRNFLDYVDKYIEYKVSD